MQLIPAIDIINGKCVRLHQGNYAQITHYHDDLEATAQHWQDQGASWLHLVDLDGAKSGKPENLQSVKNIIKHCPNLNIEIGGGIRHKDTVARYIDLGVTRIIIGSQAVRDPDFFSRISEQFPNTITLGIDSRDGKVMTCGWLEDSNSSATSLLEKFKHLPLASIIHTDIKRDGTLLGVNIESTLDLANTTSIPVYASGGVSNIEDIAKLNYYRDSIAGAILGKSLYEGKLDLNEAIQLVTKPSI